MCFSFSSNYTFFSPIELINMNIPTVDKHRTGSFNFKAGILLRAVNK